MSRNNINCIYFTEVSTAAPDPEQKGVSINLIYLMTYLRLEVIQCYHLNLKKTCDIHVQ